MEICTVCKYPRMRELERCTHLSQQSESDAVECEIRKRYTIPKWYISSMSARFSSLGANNICTSLASFVNMLEGLVVLNSATNSFRTLGCPMIFYTR